MVGEPDLISWETLSAYFSENISVTNQNTYVPVRNIYNVASHW